MSLNQDIVAKRAAANPDYPVTLKSAANEQTVDAIKKSGCTQIAEFGILDGDTSIAIARHLNNRGRLSLFDFQHNVDLVLDRMKQEGFHNIYGYGCSSRLLDNYNWSLSSLMASDNPPTFDYVFIDGAHTWNVDALTFFLIDKLLAVGGYMDFDDYDWSIASSPTSSPRVFPRTLDFYTDEQIQDRQIKRVIDVLVSKHPRYRTVVKNKIFQKIADDAVPTWRALFNRYRTRRAMSTP